MSGYVYSSHSFGRSSIIRQGRQHYVMWQHNDPRKIIAISRVDYLRIKKMLGPIEDTYEMPDVHVKYRHKQTTKVYMRVKRYLMKLGVIEQ